MDLQQLIDTKKYRGLLVLSDLHSVIEALDKALTYANDNDLFIVMLGDLVDGTGTQPMECVQRVQALLDSMSGALVIGNHDSKFYRYGLGNPVKIGPDQEVTLGRVYKKDFIKIMTDLHTHEMSSHYFYFGHTFFAHASVNKSMWEKPDANNLTSGQLARCMFGETSNKLDAKGWPVRTYGWVDDIPTGYSSVTGHDRQSLGKQENLPAVIKNHQGGTAYLTDTGCGKVEGYPLNGTVFSFINDELSFVTFRSFR